MFPGSKWYKCAARNVRSCLIAGSVPNADMFIELKTWQEKGDTHDLRKDTI